MPLRSEDCEATAEALRALGVEFLRFGDTVRVIPHRWRSPALPIDCGNSGTTMRLLAGVLAAAPGIEAELTGDTSLSRRPMGRVREPLVQMGAKIEGDFAPIRITGASLRGIEYQSPVASAQVKSAVLLAGLRAEGETSVSEPSPSRDHTERMLGALGVPISTNANRVKVVGGTRWPGFMMEVPGDISSAAFWMVAAALIPGSDITLREVGLNPTRTGILDVFAAAGIPFEVSESAEALGELFGNLRIRPAERLNPFRIDGPLVPRLIDEIPVLAVLATQCAGQTEIRDASELRVKESDRIATVVDGLRRMGAEIVAQDDGMVIEGPTPLHATEIDAGGDHRVGMAFAIAGMIAEGTTIIQHSDSIRSSYPGFREHLSRLQRGPA